MAITVKPGDSCFMCKRNFNSGDRVRIFIRSKLFREAYWCCLDNPECLAKMDQALLGMKIKKDKCTVEDLTV